MDDITERFPGSPTLRTTMAAAPFLFRKLLTLLILSDDCDKQQKKYFQTIVSLWQTTELPSRDNAKTSICPQRTNKHHWIIYMIVWQNFSCAQATKLFFHKALPNWLWQTKIIFNKLKDELRSSDISSAFFSWAFLFSSWKMYLANIRAPLPQRLQNQILRLVCEYCAQIFPRLVPGLGGLGYGLLCIPTMIAFYYTVIMAWAFYFMFQVTTTATSVSSLRCCNSFLFRPQSSTCAFGWAKRGFMIFFLPFYRPINASGPPIWSFTL